MDRRSMNTLNHKTDPHLYIPLLYAKTLTNPLISMDFIKIFCFSCTAENAIL